MLSQKRICIGYICIRFRQYNILAWPWIKLDGTLDYRVSDKPRVILKYMYSYGNRKPNTLKSGVVLPILNKWYFSNPVVSANIEIIKFDTHILFITWQFPITYFSGGSCSILCSFLSIVLSTIVVYLLVLSLFGYCTACPSIYGFWLLIDISDESYSYFILILESYLLY